MASSWLRCMYWSAQKDSGYATAWIRSTWESLVKSVEHCLTVIIRDKLFTAESLATFIFEVEFIVNHQPIIPVSDDVNDFEALTLDHFIIGTDCYNFSPGVFEINLHPEMVLGPGCSKLILGQVETRITFHGKCHKIETSELKT